MLSSIRTGSLRCVFATPLSRGIHLSRVLADDKASKSGPGRGKRVVATEGAIYAEAAEIASKGEEEDAALQQGSSILTAQPIDSVNALDDKPQKSEKVTSRGYMGWVLTQSKPYKNMKPGQTNYINGSNRPFPLNPFFRPKMPVPDAKKEQIYKDYLRSPEKNTPRVLGAKYNISIKRVEAIIKLKAIEHHMVHHGQIVAQKGLTAGMESILGMTQSSHSVKEPLVAEVPRISSPRFHAVPEGQEFSAADAAEVLGRKPYQHILDRMAASKPFVVNYPGLDPQFAPIPSIKLSMSEQARLESLGPAEEQIVGKDDALTSRRWKFVFTDIGTNASMKDRQVLIREQDGTLKKAGRDYKLKRYGQLWKH